MNSILSVRTALIVSLTLGLAPFRPEPHIWGKLRWIAGGAVGMQAVDWFDFVLHGAPWAVLVFLLLKQWRLKSKKTSL
jgi:hypothetical protein